MWNGASEKIAAFSFVFARSPCSCFMEVLESFQNSSKIVFFTFSCLNDVVLCYNPVVNDVKFPSRCNM